MTPRPWQHLYRKARWKKGRLAFLNQHPLCAMCGRAAEVVDHKRPHRGDERLFWAVTNWQALCAHCHDSHKRRQELSGVFHGCDASGIPIDRWHHWNSRQGRGG